MVCRLAHDPSIHKLQVVLSNLVQICSDVTRLPLLQQNLLRQTWIFRPMVTVMHRVQNVLCSLWYNKSEGALTVEESHLAPGTPVLASTIKKCMQNHDNLS